MADTAALYAQRLAQGFRATRQRSAQERLREAQGMERHLGVLAAVKKPHVPAYVFLGIIALALEVLDFGETPTSVTGIVWVLQLLLEVGFFLMIRAMIGRGVATSWLLIAGALIYLATSAITAPIFFPLLVFLAFTNRQAHVIQKSKEVLVGRIESLDLQIARYSTRVERLARTAARASRQLGRISRTVPGARIAGRIRLASRRITKASRTINRALRNTIGNALPIVELIPFQLWTVYSTYRDQLRVWHEAKAFLVEYEEKMLERYRLEEEELALTAIITGEVLATQEASLPQSVTPDDVTAPYEERAPPKSYELAYGS
jgi:hypothetical protein